MKSIYSTCTCTCTLNADTIDLSDVINFDNMRKVFVALPAFLVLVSSFLQCVRGNHGASCAFLTNRKLQRHLIGIQTRETKLPLIVLKDAMTTTTTDFVISDNIIWAIRLVSAIGSYVGFVSYYDRPGGVLNVEENVQVEIKPSMVPGAGLGLYAKSNLQRGTVLGTYPGTIIPLQQNLNKLRQYPACEGYIWRFSDNQFGRCLKYSVLLSWIH
jgi:hypothetical protein